VVKRWTAAVTGLVMVTAIGAASAASAAPAAAKIPLTVAVAPGSVTAGSTKNVLTFTVKATGAAKGGLSVTVPAGWSAPQSSKSAKHGYVAVHKATCSSAHSVAISKRRIRVSFSCAKGKHFTLTYGGTAKTSKVTAPGPAGSYAFATQAKIGSGSYRTLAVQPSVTVSPGALAKLVISPSGATSQAPTEFLRNHMDVHETDPGQLPVNVGFTAEGFDAFGNDLGDETASAQWSITSNTDGSSCGLSGPKEFCTAGALGPHGVDATIGTVSADTVDLDAEFEAPGYTCEGDNYDVNNDPADGCEINQPLDAHTQASAATVGTGSVSCFNVSNSFTGVLPSDGRVHMVPAVPGFNAVTGSAPEWYTIMATGGATCGDSISLTMTMSSSTIPDCYEISVVTNVDTYSETTDNTGKATITEPDGAYTDPSAVYFEVQKTCAATSRDDPTYSVTFTL
jgi:hypothetical protein